MADIEELLLLKAGEASSLNEGQRLVSLNLAVDFGGEARNKVVEQERQRKTDRAMGKVLKGGQILRHCPTLSQFEQSPHPVFILRRGKACLKSFKESWPGGELAISNHPLEPSQSAAIHVK